MKRVLWMAVGVMTATTLSTAVLAQTTTPQPTSGTTATQPGQQVTLIGCVQREADYRQAQDKGRGGAAGTGIGVRDEFVLANASMAAQGLNPDAPAADPAYELTGPNEEKVKEFVGKRVQIIGKLKPAEAGVAGTPTGGATAGRPPTGIDVASKDLKLRELEVMSVTASTTGTCTPQ
jgi:hypothetical protein